MHTSLGRYRNKKCILGWFNLGIESAYFRGVDVEVDVDVDVHTLM
jgi:hypothetical protein